MYYPFILNDHDISCNFVYKVYRYINEITRDILEFLNSHVSSNTILIVSHQYNDCDNNKIIIKTISSDFKSRFDNLNLRKFVNLDDVQIIIHVNMYFSEVFVFTKNKKDCIYFELLL